VADEVRGHYVGTMSLGISVTHLSENPEVMPRDPFCFWEISVGLWMFQFLKLAFPFFAKVQCI